MAQSDIDNTRLQRDAVASRIEENLKMLHEAEQQHRITISRRQAYEKDFSMERDPLLEPLRGAVLAQERRMEEIDLQRRALTLRSPVAGRISQVLARTGQYVLAGEPVVFVEEETASEIVVYAPEVAAKLVAEGALIRAMRRGSPGVVSESMVTRVGAAIEMTPQRLWRDPAVPEYGLPFVIAAAPQLRLTPGELVTVATARN
jgi:multidrug resistance efflux pump